MTRKLPWLFLTLLAGCVEQPAYRMDRMPYDVAPRPLPPPYATAPVTSTPLPPPGTDLRADPGAPTPLEPPLAALPTPGTLTIIGPGDLEGSAPPAPPAEAVVPPMADPPPATEGSGRDPVEQLLLKPMPDAAATASPPRPAASLPQPGQNSNTDVPMMGFRPMRGQKPTPAP